MYKLIKLEDIVRISPESLKKDLNKVTKDVVKENSEGKLYRDIGMILLAKNVKRIGDGEIVPGDGSVYQRVRFDALVFQPENQEFVEGRVSQVVEFGAFLRFGPLDGLIHVSQIMNDYIDVDLANERLIGKESKNVLKVNSRCRARIVSLSLNESNPKMSRIGLTMRQPGMGNMEWSNKKTEEESNKKESTKKVEKK